MKAREHIRRRLTLIDTSVDAISWDAIIGRIRTWASCRQSRYICLCNAASLIAGLRNPEFRQAVRAADTAAPDGPLVAWLMRRRGVLLQERIDGPALIWRYAERAVIDGTPIFLYGATDATLAKTIDNLLRSFPGLNIVGRAASPSAPQSVEAEDGIVRRIMESDAHVVFVGLNCPQQELWMAKVSARIPAVLIGVGSSFDYLARKAPPHRLLDRVQRFLQRCIAAGLEAGAKTTPTPEYSLAERSQRRDDV